MPKLPGINHQKAVKAFKKTGFWIVRQGKHIAMTNGDRIITIPRANSPITSQLWTSTFHLPPLSYELNLCHAKQD
jgi:predicted RNA binding protein YcfA (HicA-like mRNA interferase family)